jgi:hypothetical protein
VGFLHSRCVKFPGPETPILWGHFRQSIWYPLLHITVKQYVSASRQAWRDCAYEKQKSGQRVGQFSGDKPMPREAGIFSKAQMPNQG